MSSNKGAVGGAPVCCIPKEWYFNDKHKKAYVNDYTYLNDRLTFVNLYLQITISELQTGIELATF